MKILPVNFVNYTQNRKNIKIQKNNLSKINNQTYSNADFKNYFLPFLGGISLDLIKTNEAVSEDECPVNIKEEIEKEIILNPDTKKTLQDIHFEKYKDVLECYSLDELKEKYPEFNDIISAFDVKSQNNSFIDDFQKGKSEVFPNNEDLTLQLIKLYWAKGFSLNDLSKYIGENSSNRDKMNLYSVFKKLNIPTMNSRYAQILKLSNKQYNEDLYETILIKKKEARLAQEQLLEGEPVIIPRGPLSEAHRRHISEGLKRYYQNNPDAIYNLSKRQKEFYENNPDEKENLSIAADCAWNKTKEGKSVKKHLSKFMKKQNAIISDDELEFKKDITTSNKTILKAFWQKNPWARTMFSTAMEIGWQKVKELKDEPTEQMPETKIYYFNTFPTEVKEEFIKWANEHNYDTSKWQNVGTVSICEAGKEGLISKEDEEIAKKINPISNKYFIINKKLANEVATTSMLALISVLQDLNKYHYRLPKGIRNDLKAINILKNFYKHTNDKVRFYYINSAKDVSGIPGVTSEEISQVEQSILPAFCMFDAQGFMEYYNERMDEAYEYIKNNKLQDAVNKFLT